jgi:carboxyl-terminal processing protease
VWRVEQNGPAARAGVRPGWIINAIDSTDIDSAVADLRAVRDARLRRTLFTQVTARLQHRFDGSADSHVSAVFQDERGKLRELDMTRAPVSGTPIKMGHMPMMVLHASAQRIDSATASNRCVGVIGFNYWLPHVMPKLASAMNDFQSCDGVVLDLRGNVGGLAAMLSGVAGFLSDTAATLAVQRSRGQEQRYDIFPRLANAQGERVRPFDGAIAILLDPLSVSTTEVFAAGMRYVSHGRARIFGERSAGQALPSLIYKLPSGDVLLHAIADLRLSDGTRIEGEGVRPDVEVPLRQSDLLAGRDAALEAAIRWIADWNKSGGR